jgi:hypothetical protein
VLPLLERGGAEIGAVTALEKSPAVLELLAFTELEAPPEHATMPLEELERLLCRELGHRADWEERAQPVTEFWICRRCGKFWR